MYTTWQGFETEIYKDDRQVSGKVTIGSHEFLDSGELVSVKLSLSSSDNLIVGQVVSQSADVEMNISNENFQTYFDVSSDVTVYIGVPNGETVGYIPRPPMRITNHDYDKETGKLTFSCVDYMSKADQYTVNDLPDMQYPVTVDNYLQAICTKIGVSKSAASYFNSTVSLSAPPNFDGSESLRTALKGIAQMCLSNCCINKDGALEMKCIADSTSVETISGDYYYTATAGKKIIGINKVALVRQPQNDIIYSEDSLLVQQDGESSLIIENNPFMDSSRETFAPALLTKIKGLSFYPCEISWRGNFALDPFDKVTVQTVDNVTFSTYLFCEELIFNGGLKSTIKNNCDNNKTVDYAKGSTIKDKIKNAEIEVDKVKNQITSLVQEDEYLQSQIVQTADNILTEVQEKYATNDSVDERFTQINQTASQVQISVNQVNSRVDDLESNGVDKVVNTTGTFDENGLSIGKSDSEFSSLLDNTGLFLKSRGEDIASYTKDGAVLKNLTVINEMYLGNLRVMKVVVNGEKRTHIHWIGE